MLLTRRSDLALDNDANSRFLPILVAVMVFLATLATTGALALQGVLARWSLDVSGTMTVQVMPAGGDPAKSAPETGRRVAAAVQVLRDTPGVAGARSLEDSEIATLLEPWLGNVDLLADLPVPRLIDVSLVPGARVDIEALSRRLSAVAPGTSLDDHQAWLSKLVRLGQGLEALAVAVVVLVAVATALTVVYATRTGLAVHRPQIEVLHMIGAQDDYIARQFAHKILVLGLRGGLIGLGMAVPLFAGIAWLGTKVEAGLVPRIGLSPSEWAIVAALPLAAAYLAKITARITVHRTLRRMV